MFKIAVASGKGGTGKTFLSTNLFVSMRREGLDAALVDCDAEVPNDRIFIEGEEVDSWPVEVLCPEIVPDYCAYCGRCADFCAFNAIVCLPAAKYIRLMTDLCHGCGACLQVCDNGAVSERYKPAGTVTAYDVSGVFPELGKKKTLLYEARIREGEHSPVPVIREAIRRSVTLGMDYLILDAPPGCSCPFVSTVSESDYVVLVAEPTPFGLSDLKHTVQVLRRIGKPFGVVINRSDSGDGKMEDYLLAEKIDVLAGFRYSKQIASAYASGKLAVDSVEGIRQKFSGLKDEIIKRR